MLSEFPVKCFKVEEIAYFLEIKNDLGERKVNKRKGKGEVKVIITRATIPILSKMLHS